MWRFAMRVFLALWFVGMVGLAVWNGRGAEAQGGGMQTLYLPLMENTDPATQGYVGLVVIDRADFTVDFYTVGANGRGWMPLRVGAADDISFYDAWSWSPNGHYFVHHNDEGISNSPGVWLVPLSSRTPRQLLDGYGVGFRWSPDSRYVAFHDATTLYLYDVQTDTLITIPAISTRLLFWSPDSRVVGWQENYSSTDYTSDFWLWNVTEGTRWKIFTGVLSNVEPGYLPIWSPDSRRLLFTVNENNNTSIYSASVVGGHATRILEQAIMRGWVEAGARILVQSESRLYLAQPDGSNLTLFSEDSRNTVIVSPMGDSVLMGDYYTEGSSFIQPIGSNVPTNIPGCRGFTLQWRADGQRFACASHTVGGNFGARLGTTTTVPPTVSAILQPYLTPRFLPHSTSHLAVDRYLEGYPSAFLGSYIYNYETDVYKQITYPEAQPGRVLEWRYLP